MGDGGSAEVAAERRSFGNENLLKDFNRGSDIFEPMLKFTSLWGK